MVLASQRRTRRRSVARKVQQVGCENRSKLDDVMIKKGRGEVKSRLLGVYYLLTVTVYCIQSYSKSMHKSVYQILCDGRDWCVRGIIQYTNAKHDNQLNTENDKC